MLLPIARRHGARLTVHGDAALAKACGADGVHLPAGADAAQARKILGREKLLGVSLHTVTEAAKLAFADREAWYADPDFAWAPSLITAGSGTQWQTDYDGNGNVVGQTDPAGQRWDYAWDARNNLLQVLEPLVTDAWGVTEPARRRTDCSF